MKQDHLDRDWPPNTSVISYLLNKYLWLVLPNTARSSTGSVYSPRSRRTAEPTIFTPGIWKWILLQCSFLWKIVRRLFFFFKSMEELSSLVKHWPLGSCRSTVTKNKGISLNTAIHSYLWDLRFLMGCLDGKGWNKEALQCFYFLDNQVSRFLQEMAHIFSCLPFVTEILVTIFLVDLDTLGQTQFYLGFTFLNSVPNCLNNISISSRLPVLAYTSHMMYFSKYIKWPQGNYMGETNTATKHQTEWITDEKQIYSKIWEYFSQNSNFIFTFSVLVLKGNLRNSNLQSTSLGTKIHNTTGKQKSQTE